MTSRIATFVLAALVTAVLATLASASPALAALPSGNLLQNGDAEAGSCSNDTGTAETIPGWTTTSSFTVVCYSSGVSQTSDSGAAIGGGNGYFMGGVDDGTTATQTVDVSAAATDIDAGGVQAELAGYLGGFSSQDDNMVVVAVFLNGSGGALGSPIEIGPVTHVDRSDQTEMLLQTHISAVPVGTRSIEVVMTATRTDGSDNDAAADNLSLTLSSTSTPSGPFAGTDTATGITATSAMLNGEVTPRGLFTSAYFEYGTTTGYGGQTSDVAVGSDSSVHSVQKIVNTLEPGTTYHYRIVALNSSGTTDGNDQSFTTSAVTPVEGADRCLNVTSTSATYEFFVNPGGEKTSLYVNSQFQGFIGSNGDNSLEKVDVPMTGLTPYTSNGIQLMVQNSAGEVTWTGACFTPDKPGIFQPTVDTITATSALVHATVNPHVSAAQVHVEYGKTSSYGQVTQPVSFAATANLYQYAQGLSDLSAGTTYHYRIVATNGAGTFSTPDLTFTTSSVSSGGGTITVAGGIAHPTILCLTPRPCTGSLSLVTRGSLVASTGKRRLVLGHARFHVRAHKRASVKVRLSRPAMAALRRKGKLRVTEQVTSKLGGGHTAVTSRTVNLRVPR